MVDQRELERLARQGAADIRSGKKKDWEVAQELQAAATGQSQGVEELKGIEGRLAQQGPDGITMIDQSRARGLGIPMQPGASPTHSNIGANPEALKIEQMRRANNSTQAVDRANNPTQAESMQRMNSQQPPSGAFGGDSLPWVMQTQPREIFRDLPNRRAMMPNQGGGQYVVTQTPNGVELNTPSNPQVAPSNLPNPKTQEFNTFPPKIQRGQPGFMDYLEGAGRGLQSMGKGMSGYAEKLFNDPNRMAMLQGGLSMMNPNSYYDKQGFGNVFQGLETGLGQAQKGMKGVLDRRALSAKTALDKLGGKKTYKTFTETNPQGNPVKINYELDGRGGRKEISRSNITKLVSGVNDKGELSVQQFNVTTGDLKDVVVKKGIDPQQAQKYLSLIDQVEDWDEALKKYPYSASEIPGKGFDMVNLIVESLFRETPIEGRAKIETMKAQLKPLITPEILKDSRISKAEWEMIDAFLGNGMLSSGLQKERAVPAILKLLRIGGGIQGSVGGTGGGTDFEKKYPEFAGKV